jgi:prolyl-tRNA synthetase
MRYSSLFGKTTHGEQKGSKLKSHQLLVKGGFIRESAAGRYFFLPLGWRVHDKIKAVIKQEMDKAGSQEMLSPTLHPLELWKETNRTNTAGFELMKIVDRRGGEFALGGTAEEMFTDVVRKFNLSHKDLPFSIYQFSNKFRDELRARGGLLRLREFIMKDAYSFDVDEQAFKKEYENMKQTYLTIFNRLGLDTLVVEADNGYIGGEYCHEFQVEHPEGEGRFFVTEDGSYCAHEDVATFQHVHMNPDEEVEDFAIVEQPEWVRTMEDNLKHYGQPAWRYLKNVVYRTPEGDIVIATIRGDLDVNKNKLEHVLDLVGQLEEATGENLSAIGTKHGYVHAWGHSFVQSRKAKSQQRDCRVIYVADESLKHVKNFIGGQKEEKSDSKHVNYGRDFTHEIEADIAMAQAGFLTQTGQKLIEKRGIEVGNIFQLGHHYANKMSNASFIASDGSKQPYYMGSYGIGLARTMATIAEIYHDDKGLAWPEIIAPYAVHLLSLKGGEQKAEALYQKLQDAQVEVLWDERDVSPGSKFADADLIGCPVRLVVSQKTGDQVEWKKRAETTFSLLDTQEVIKRLTTGL